MPRISAKAPRVKAVAPGLGKEECGRDSDEATSPQSVRVEIYEAAEGITRCRRAISFKAPVLNKRMIKVAGKVPRLPSLRVKPVAAVREVEPVEKGAIKRSPEPMPSVEPPTEALVTVVPTPRKRAIRPQRAKAAPVEPAAPKPLKVIRRRREEAPKIFETPPKSLPKAMLEGIDLEPETDAEN